MKCSRCGYENDKGYYCTNCGSPLAVPVQQNQPVADGTGSKSDESRQKTIRTAIISAAAVILAIVIAVTSVLIYNNSVTAVAADSVIYNDSEEDYCVVIKNSKKEIVSKDIIKPDNKYLLDLDEGIYFVNMKSLNAKGDTIYFKKIKIVSDSKDAATIQLDVTEDFDETDNFDEEDFEDIDELIQETELDPEDEQVDVLIDKLTMYRYADSCVCTLLESGGFENGDIAEDIVVRMAYSGIKVNSDAVQYIYSDSYGSTVVRTDASAVKKQIKYIFGYEDYSFSNYITYPLYDPNGAMAYFLNYDASLESADIYYYPDKNYFAHEHYDGGGGDMPCILLSFYKAVQHGNDIKIYINKGFADTIYDDSTMDFAYDLYKTVEYSKPAEKVGSCPSSVIYDNESWDDNGNYSGICKNPTDEYKKITDKLDCCCFTFTQAEDAEYYLTGFDPDVKKSDIKN